MTRGEPPKKDRLDQVVEWLVDHVEVDANFEGVPALFVGDPLALKDAPSRHEDMLPDPWSWLDLPSGRALAVRGPGSDTDGPFVWVLGSDDGPLSSIEISPRLETAPAGSRPEPVGTIECLSGRIVIGSPESISWWGPGVDTSKQDRLAEMRVADVPGPLRDGYIVVARLVEPGPCTVLASPGERPQSIAGISIHFPTPAWLPPAQPIVEPQER